MSDNFPQSESRVLEFQHGTTRGFSHRWANGQYCSIITPVGIVGCGIYDLATAAEFGQAIAIAKGTPAQPLVHPEDLLDAKIVGVTPLAAEFGVQAGMTGREAVECFLKQTSQSQTAS